MAVTTKPEYPRSHIFEFSEGYPVDIGAGELDDACENRKRP